MHICKFLLICLNLLNSVKEKCQYSVKLRLFDNRMNLGNQTVVAVHHYCK